MVSGTSDPGGYLMLLGIAGFATCLVSYLLCQSAIASGWAMDAVSHRSSHRVATTRLGGLTVMIPFFVAVPLVYLVFGLPLDSVVWTVLIAGFAATVLGFLDDMYTLPALVKFAGQFALALGACAVTGGLQIIPLPDGSLLDTGPFSVALGVFWIVGFINVFNFMDGVNGLAAGTAILAGLMLALIAATVSDSSAFSIFFLMASALYGFFLNNYRRGKIFLGDSGSHGIATTFAIMALIWAQPDMAPGNNGALTPRMFLTVPFIFLPHILDVTLTLVLRAARRTPLHHAHKEHVYQRLHQSGWRHQQVTNLYILATVFCGASAYVMGTYWPQSIWTAIVAAIILFLGAAVLKFGNTLKQSV